MSELADLKKILDDIQSNVANLSKQLYVSNDTVKLVCEENSKLKSDIEKMKTAINRQASYISSLDSELDDLGQYE